MVSVNPVPGIVLLGWTVVEGRAVVGGGLVVSHGVQLDVVVANREVVTHCGRVVVGEVGVGPGEVPRVLAVEVTEPTEVVRVPPMGTGPPGRVPTGAVDVGTMVRDPLWVVAE